MKKIALINLLGLLLLLQASQTKGQNLIAVQNGNRPSFYTKLDSAITFAQNGDTIYIPGGGFTINDTINKRIHLVGVGHHPDSTNVTARTLISGSRQLILKSGADNGSVTGIYFIDPGYDGYDNIQIIGSVTGYTISRCYVTRGITQNPLSNNLTLTENIIVNSSLSGTKNSCINNIFLGFVYNSSGTIKNNVFTFSQPGYKQYAFYFGDNIVENNIFMPGTVFLDTYNGTSIYHNNANGGINGIFGSNQGSSNFLDNTNLKSIFVNFDPTTTGSGEAIYKADFHLKSESPYKNAGRDGTDIGIYGGAYPWKEGSIPSNPHFQTINIAPKTDNSGNLNVKIKVAAQDH